jgi:hypothetical protein
MACLFDQVIAVARREHGWRCPKQSRGPGAARLRALAQAHDDVLHALIDGGSLTSIHAGAARIVEMEDQLHELRADMLFARDRVRR